MLLILAEGLLSSLFTLEQSNGDDVYYDLDDINFAFVVIYCDSFVSLRMPGRRLQDGFGTKTSPQIAQLRQQSAFLKSCKSLPIFGNKP